MPASAISANEWLGTYGTDRRNLAADRAKALSAVRDELGAVLIGQLPKGTEIAKSAKPINGDDSCGSF